MKVAVNHAPIGAPVIAGWGIAANGAPVARFCAGGVDVIVEFESPEQARDFAVDGCFAFGVAAQQRQGNGLPKGVPSRLVGVDGLPLIAGGG